MRHIRERGAKLTLCGLSGNALDYKPIVVLVEPRYRRPSEILCSICKKMVLDKRLEGNLFD